MPEWDPVRTVTQVAPWTRGAHFWVLGSKRAGNNHKQGAGLESPISSPPPPPWGKGAPPPWGESKGPEPPPPPPNPPPLGAICTLPSAGNQGAQNPCPTRKPSPQCHPPAWVGVGSASRVQWTGSRPGPKGSVWTRGTRSRRASTRGGGGRRAQGPHGPGEG